MLMKTATRPLSIRLQGCAKTFNGGQRVLEPLDLDIHAGETLVLLGPSGCGKTTTLRMIAGLEQPDAGGKVLFDGEDVTALGIEKRNVGMVFQSYALFPNMTVAENVGYGLRIRKMPAQQQRERIAEMLAMMRIEALADRGISQLSGGQRQRVALARALAVRPRALLLDEPLTALDAKLRDTLRLEINSLLRSLGITTIYVTHDQGEAMALGDRIIVMSQGKVAQIGTPRQIYHHPASAFVADFIGTMNRLAGKVREQAFATSAGLLPWPEATPSATSVMFRPEDVTLTDRPDQATLRARVADSLFLGDRTRLFLNTPAAETIIVDSLSRTSYEPGTMVGFKIDPRALIAQ